MTWIETCRVIHVSRWTSPLCPNSLRYWDELKRAKIKLLSRICYLCCLPLPNLRVLQGLRTPDSCMDVSLLLHQRWQPLKTWTYPAEKYFMEVLEWVRRRTTRMIIILTLSGVSPIPNRKPFIYPFPMIRPHLKRRPLLDIEGSLGSSSMGCSRSWSCSFSPSSQTVWITAGGSALNEVLFFLVARTAGLSQSTTELNPST